MNWRTTHFYDKAQIAVTAICASVCVLISVFGFFGYSMSPEKNVLLILGLIPLISFLLMLKLRNIEKRLSEESRFFSESTAVINELIEMCNSANDYILAVGSRTKGRLLEAIENAIESKEIYYHRLLVGNEVTKDLEEHIERIEGRGNQTIKFLAVHNCHCPNFLLTEKMVMILLPIPESEKFRGVALSSQEAINQYLEYFGQLFNDDDAKPFKRVADIRDCFDQPDIQSQR